MNRLLFARLATGASILFAASVMVAAGPAAAQTAVYPGGAPEVPDLASVPDWDGLWERDQDNVWDNRIPVGQPQVPPYNAEYQDLFKNGPPGKRGSAFNSMPGYMSMLFPMEIQVSRMQVTVTSENKDFLRRIYTDGRSHSEETLPSSNGHSVGRWENGQLFVETCCIREDTRLPGNGPHSDAMSIKEHWYLRDAKTLVIDIIVEDPKAFTGPWTTQKIFYRRPDWEPVEYDREENDRDEPVQGRAAPGEGRPAQGE